MAHQHEIRGGCHCGNITFCLYTNRAPQDLHWRPCGCSFCQTHGVVHTSDPEGELNVAVAEPSRLSRYRFASETADFYVCARCGVMPLVTSHAEGRERAVVNVRTVSSPPMTLGSAAPVSFDGETVEQRLARRARNWIGRVSHDAS